MYIEEMVGLPTEIEEVMLCDCAQYDRAHGVDMNYQKYAFVLRSQDGCVRGVLSYYTIFAEIFIDMLWVDAQYRRQGWGKKLVEKLEKNYAHQGFNNINLYTYAFQAPAFYERCGFTLEFVRKNPHHPLLSKYFFVKFFDEAQQNQGILSASRS